MSEKSWGQNKNVADKHALQFNKSSLTKQKISTRNLFGKALRKDDEKNRNNCLKKTNQTAAREL